MSNNVCQDKDNTFKLLNKLRKYENIVVLSADNESCTVSLNRTDYVYKVDLMIDEGISKGKYVETVDSTHKDLKHFQDSLYRHFYKRNIMMACVPFLINLYVFSPSLKHINSILVKILMLKIGILDPL